MSNDLFLHRHTKAYRRSNQYPLLDTPSDVSTQAWVVSVTKQRAVHPDQPYLSPLLPIDRSSSLSLYSISTLIAMGGYRYTGIKVLDYPLYRNRYIVTTIGLWDDHTIIGDALSVGDMDDDYLTRTAPPTTGLHWEFMKGTHALMEDREYLYLPVGTYTESVMQLIPSMPYWDSATHASASSGYLLPDRNYLLPSNHMDYGEWYNISPIGIGIAPFLPGLVSTGVTTILGDGEILYEYQDVEGWYSIPGTLYMSPLRPSNHQYPLGRPKPQDLVQDTCLLVGGYLTKGTTPWIGYSTGYRTTSSYHPSRTYYLYEDLDGGTFLHDAEPSPNVWPLIEDLLGPRGVPSVGTGGITISVPCVRDELYVRDYSCGVIILLPDLPLLGYTDGALWDDCTIIGDRYYMAWDPCNNYWGDRLMMDDYQEMDPCVVLVLDCNRPCLWDDRYVFDNDLCEGK